MPSKTPGVSTKGRSQRGQGKGSGRCITASPAASVADPVEIHGVTEPSAEPQLKTAAWRAETEIDDDSGEDADSTNVANAIQEKKKMKVAPRLNYVNAVFATSLLLRPHLTTSSLRFFEHVQSSSTSSTFMETTPRPYRFVLRSYYDVHCTSSYCVHPIF